MREKTCSWVARYWATTPVPLLGGVAKATSSRWARKKDALTYLEVALANNREANRPCAGQVVPSPDLPEIFPHCRSSLVQSVGCRCFGCGKQLDHQDAALAAKLAREE
jgi:hypothetical protein